MLSSDDSSGFYCTLHILKQNRDMADERFVNKPGDAELDPEVYGLAYKQETVMSPWEFDRSMGYIGAYSSNQGYFINILCLQGVKVTNQDAYLHNKGGKLKLVKNVFNRFDDVVILRYTIPSSKEVLEWVRQWMAPEQDKPKPGELAEKMELLKDDLALPVWNDPHLKVSEDVKRKWEQNFLTPGNHIHIFPGTVNPGYDRADKKTAQMGLGQHAFRRGAHKKRYRALNPCTKEENKTLGWRKPAEQPHYVDETAQIYEDLTYTNIHYGQNTEVGKGSTGCINIRGWQKDRYEYFMLTAYIHGGPKNPLTEIPVTIWPGVDFFKFKKKERGEYVGQEHMGLPELHFASFDTKQVRPGWRSKPGWVEKMQRILWEWRNRPSPEPNWGLFNKDTVHRLLWYFQDHAIKNLEDTDKTKHYYRRLYSKDTKDWEDHEYWLPKETDVLYQLMEEREEAICGPATWEAMRFFCPEAYQKWVYGS